jgi:hypothetical protein
MRITKTTVTRSCAICERTLLMGERTTRFAPDGGEDFVDVCALCQEAALGYGWLKEGSPSSPVVSPDRRRRRSLLGGRRIAAEEPVLSEPILRRLSDHELRIVDAADCFNSSAYRRTVEGIAKSLGNPQISIVPLSGVNNELVLTVAWDLSWYQYRVALDQPQPVRLAERGYELGELDDPYKAWNARLTGDGRVMPEIEPL